MSFARAWLVAAVVVTVSPAWALTLVVETGEFGCVPGGPGFERYVLEINGSGFNASYNGSRSVTDVSDGDLFHFVFGYTAEMGTFQVVDKGGTFAFEYVNASGTNPDLAVNFNPGVYDAGANTLTVTLQTAPMAVNVGSYQGGWNIHNNITWGGAGNYTANLPLAFDNAHFYTPGNQNTFSRAADGKITVADRDGGIVVLAGDGSLTIDPSLIVTLTYNMDEGMPDGWYQFNGAGGTGIGIGNTGNGHNTYGEGTVNFMPGVYNIEVGGSNNWVDGSGRVTIPFDINNPDAWEAAGWTYTTKGWTHTASWVDGETTSNMMIFYAGAVPVPEPVTMTLLALGGLAMLRRGRR